MISWEGRYNACCIGVLVGIAFTAVYYDVVTSKLLLIITVGLVANIIIMAGKFFARQS